MTEALITEANVRKTESWRRILSIDAWQLMAGHVGSFEECYFAKIIALLRSASISH